MNQRVMYLRKKLLLQELCCFGGGYKLAESEIHVTFALVRL